MPNDYDPSSVEQKWQKKWADARAHETDLAAAKKDEKFYGLVMFPYPSGDKLHVGHWYNFAPADSFARFQRMKGKTVFTPMGFDAFGLPAENYAIKTGTPPAESTARNVETMIAQLSRIGTMYDWTKTLNTSDPSYYRWTQWLFLQMHEHGLAYRKNANVNWCPNDQTVLANEQVKDGMCERCGTEVVQKALTQWFWNITKYADKLIDNLDDLDWPEKTKLMQRNWIGRSEGAEIEFDVEDFSTESVSLAAELIPQLTKRVVHITFSPHKRSALFGDADIAGEMLRILKRVADDHDITLYEAAVMPEHIHLLVGFEHGRNLEQDVVKKLKGASARYFAQSQGWDEGQHVWQRSKHFEDVTDERQFLSVLNYIRSNPEKAGIIAKKRILSKMLKTIRVFTTRPDTLFGVTYIVLAPEHPLVDVITPKDHLGAVSAYREEVKKKTEMQRTDLNKVKSGVPTGAFALHPVTGEKLPIWIADYVLMNYGTGAVMAVPGHDERDWEFAKTMNLPMIEVVAGGNIEEVAFTGEGTATNSQFLDGLSTSDAKKKMIAWLEDAEKGRGLINYRLRDWLVSRQRYWGAPIPIVYDPEGNPHPVPEEHLPWLLPTDVEFKPTGKSPLHDSKEFIERTEKIFGKGWTPEFDTMDTFVCSSFYYLLYLSTEGYGLKADSKKQKHALPIDHTIERTWMPVDMYIGGPEHATMHLIYARFVMMALKDFGFVSHEEPFRRLVHQGLITNQGAKMSKSKGNVVSPDGFVERYGSDVFRMYLMFMGPFTDGGDWNDTGIKGTARFVQRVWKYLTTCVKSGERDAPDTLAALHAAIKAVGESLEKMHFNTAIAALMTLLNHIEKQAAVSEEAARTITRLLSPLAPHLAEELWETLGGEGLIINQRWPEYDPALLTSDTFTIGVQVNGKLRGDVTVSADATKEEILAAAKGVENVRKYLEGTEIKKEVYVPGKIVSFVVG